LGREDDAYDAVALVLPDLTKSQEPADPEPEEEAGPIEAGAQEEVALVEVEAGEPTIDLDDIVPVSLYREAVPDELDPSRFFAVMIARILDNSPINFHTEARAKRRSSTT
jgi:hypothetical protein